MVLFVLDANNKLQRSIASTLLRFDPGYFAQKFLSFKRVTRHGVRRGKLLFKYNRQGWSCLGQNGLMRHINNNLDKIESSMKSKILLNLIPNTPTVTPVFLGSIPLTTALRYVG
jgi:hypothetical protein